MKHAARMAEERLAAEVNDGDQAEIRRLAALTPMQYDRERKTAAKALGVQQKTLDGQVKAARQDAEIGSELVSDPEPWPEPVAGVDLLDDLTAMFDSYLVLPNGAAETLALWTVFTHCHDAFGISPILAVTSPTPECGKTTVLTLLGAVTLRPLPASNITSAALFRAIEKWSPTLLVDEADTFIRDSDELRGIINSGHNRASAYVIRTVGDDHEAAQFKTWAPKAIALIGKLPPTLASRAIHISMRRMKPDESVRALRADRLDHLEPLRRQAARWIDDRIGALRLHDPEMPEALNGRAADNWRCLIAVADEVGGEWPERARRIAEANGAASSSQTASIMLLEDVRRIFNETGGDKLASAFLVERLINMEDRPWPEWKKGGPITPRQVAQLLEPFGIAPGTIRLDTGGTPKGYTVAAFADVFAQYLPSNPPHRHNPQKFKGKGAIRSATGESVVADQKRRKLADSVGCGGVADQCAEMPVRAPHSDPEARRVDELEREAIEQIDGATSEDVPELPAFMRRVV